MPFCQVFLMAQMVNALRSCLYGFNGFFSTSSIKMHNQVIEIINVKKTARQLAFTYIICP